jgi:hypothetical protein
MFMRNNRAKNGAPQPEQTAKKDASAQRSSRTLSTQPPLDGSPDDLRFPAQLSTCEKINDAHYRCGVTDDMGQFGLGNYDDKIPHIGKGGGDAVMGQTGDRKLSNP